MKTDKPALTPYPDINAILEKFLACVQVILGKRFIGLYLHGSLACGDFNLQTSDIDFLVVTDKRLPEEISSALKGMHAHLFASGLPWSQKLEGAYIPKDDLRRHDPAHAPVPWLGWMVTLLWKNLALIGSCNAGFFARKASSSPGRRLSP
jgi:hypothetical protein